MSLISLLVVIIVFGLIMWGINYLPIDARFKQIAYVVLVIFLVLYVLQAFGLLSGLHDIRIGR